MKQREEKAATGLTGEEAYVVTAMNTWPKADSLPVTTLGGFRLAALSGTCPECGRVIPPQHICVNRLGIVVTQDSEAMEMVFVCLGCNCATCVCLKFHSNGRITYHERGNEAEEREGVPRVPLQPVTNFLLKRGWIATNNFWRGGRLERTMFFLASAALAAAIANAIMALAGVTR